MLKQFKLLSLCALISAASLSQAVSVDAVLRIKDVSKRNHTLATYAAAIILGNIAYSLQQREFDDKGTFRTVGDNDLDPMAADASYCLAMGTGLAAIENSLTGTEDLTVKGSIDASLTNAVSFFLTNMVMAQDWCKSLDRNHIALRGWLPWSTKFDTSAKQALLFTVWRSVVSHAKKSVLN